MIIYKVNSLSAVTPIFLVLNIIFWFSLKSSVPLTSNALGLLIRVVVVLQLIDSAEKDLSAQAPLVVFTKRRHTLVRDYTFFAIFLIIPIVKPSVYTFHIHIFTGS